jgi:uncharacterized protein (TIGR02246 family)
MHTLNRGGPTRKRPAGKQKEKQSFRAMEKIAKFHISIRGMPAKVREDKMQSRLWISGVLLALSVSVQTAAAGPQEDVAAAGQKWATVFADNNPDAMLPFYAKDAVLWGTLSPTVRSEPAALKAYFVGAFQALPKATVKFGDQLIRVYGNTAVNTGYYTFSYTKDGETKSIPARYSFTYVKDGNDWKIVDHHSSAVPAPPK